MDTAIILGHAWGDWAVSALVEGFRAYDSGLNVIDVSSFSPGRAEQFFCSEVDRLGQAFAVCFGLRDPYETWVSRLSIGGVNTVVLDSGYVNRPPYNLSEQEYRESTEHTYAVSFGGILRPVEAGAKIWPEGVPESRVNLRAVGEEKKMPGLPEAVVVLGQTPEDRSHRMSAVELRETYAGWLSGVRGAAKFFRPHPRGTEILAGGGDCLPDVHALDPAEPLVSQFARLSSDFCITWKTISSNAGLDLLLSGYPGSATQAWYSKTNSREQAIRSAFGAQFTLPELRTADVAGRILHAVQSP